MVGRAVEGLFFLIFLCFLMLFWNAIPTFFQSTGSERFSPNAATWSNAEYGDDAADDDDDDDNDNDCDGDGDGHGHGDGDGDGDGDGVDDADGWMVMVMVMLMMALKTKNMMMMLTSVGFVPCMLSRV